MFNLSPVWRIKLLRSDAGSNVQRIGFLFAAAIIGFGLLPAILVAWGLYENLPEATAGIYSQGLSLGSLRISVGMIVTLAGTLYGVFLTSRILPKVLLDETVSGHKLSREVQRSIGQLIIPNADLINNQVTNWTLTNREVRLRVPVGVVYGSDVRLVVETILACAREQKDVAKSPVPEVLFMNFGDSSLNFELRVWIQGVDQRMQLNSALYHEIERKFREMNIVIPFPQRDVHFHGNDESAGLPATPGKVKEET